MKIKNIILQLVLYVFIICQVYACNKQNNANIDAQNQTTTDEKNIPKLIKTKTKNSAFKTNANKFFTAFGKLFEQKLNTDNDRINLLHKNTNQSKIKAINTDTISTKKRKEVFGFHPYWSSNSLDNYNYKLLSSISYFAYDLDPNTGKYKTLRDWKTTKLIDSAKANNTKVYLTVTNFLEENNITFLNNKKAQETSISTILQLLIEREAYGVTIDFEDIPCMGKDTIYTRKYSNYINNLYTRLKEFDKKVVVMLPAIDIQNCFDVTKLYPYVEYFIVMGYNYYGSWSDVAGPVAPLHGEKLWTQWSLEATIESYLIKNIPKEKIVLAIPNYGNLWETEDDNVPSYTKKFISNLSYKTIKEKYSKKKVYFEPESQTNYLNFKDGEKFMQVWFDDARSLGKKYDYINSKDLAGVGIWALGYDDGHPELWDVLDMKFNQKKGYKTEPTEVTLTWMSIFKKVSVLKGLLWVLSIIFILGFLLSLRTKEIRDIVLKRELIKNLILFGIPFLIFITLYISLVEKIWSFIILAGILIGYGLYYLLVRTEHKIINLNRIP